MADCRFRLYKRGKGMGSKRIMGQFEVTFPAGEPRTLAELAEDLPVLLAQGVLEEGGTLARLAVVSAAVDPDPEPTIETLEPGGASDPTAPGGPLEWA